MAKSNPLKNIDNLSTGLAGITTYQSGVAQATAFRIVKKHTATALKEYGLSCMQWFTIGTVLDAGNKGIRLSDLAQKLDTTLAYMTTTVNFLESREILERHAHGTDARTKLIKVRNSYKKECAIIEADVRKKLATLLYGQIDSEELLAYIMVLYKISQLK